jgi:hypothetical protein
MAKIWWLASYPKSGNTWVRAFLTALLTGRRVDINDMSALGAGVASSRDLFDSVLGIESGDLTEDQQANLRPLTYELMAQEFSESPFVKVHDAYGLTPAGSPVFPSSATAGAIYIVRNPLDAAVSLAYYTGRSMERAVDVMLASGMVWGVDSQVAIANQFPQKMGTWGEHVASWLAAPFPVHVVRYEDLLRHPKEFFARIAQFCDIPATEAEIQLAVEQSSFEALRSQERDKGFRANSASGNRFFRQGKTGAWREELPPEQAERILSALGPEMNRLGYSEDLSRTFCRPGH